MRCNLLIKASVVGLIVIAGSVIGLGQGVGKPSKADAKVSAKHRAAQTPRNLLKITESVQDTTELNGDGPFGGTDAGGVGGRRPRGVAFQQAKPIKWQKPEGAPPAWLTAAKNSTDAVERMRSTLSEPTSVEILGVATLEDALVEIVDTNIIQINAAKLEESGYEPEQSISLAMEGSRREMLRRLLEPRNLAYIVHESCIEITSAEDAEARPTIRCYDLSFVQPDCGHVEELLECIQDSIYPDSWKDRGGGVFTLHVIGSVLVAKMIEPAHHRIEALLYKLSQSNPK